MMKMYGTGKDADGMKKIVRAQKAKHQHEDASIAFSQRSSSVRSPLMQARCMVFGRKAQLVSEPFREDDVKRWMQTSRSANSRGSTQRQDKLVTDQMTDRGTIRNYASRLWRCTAPKASGARLPLGPHLPNTNHSQLAFLPSAHTPTRRPVLFAGASRLLFWSFYLGRAAAVVRSNAQDDHINSFPPYHTLIVPSSQRLSTVWKLPTSAATWLWPDERILAETILRGSIVILWRRLEF